MKFVFAVFLSLVGLSSHASSLLSDFDGRYVVESRACAGDDHTCQRTKSMRMGYDTGNNESYIEETYTDYSTHIAWITEGSEGDDHTYFTAGEDGLSATWTHINKALVETLKLVREYPDGPVNFDFAARGPVNITRHFRLIPVR
ncbi:MAG: hypothetical protein JST16_18915 [Bdellovibrionales bacterium]|nr:hypothetical protein [Bdellovibrionales bacterium]